MTEKHKQDFNTALNIYENTYSHEQLIEFLKTGSVAEKQAATIKLDTISTQNDATVFMSNLTGCDGKIREAVALRINQLVATEPECRSYFNFPLVFADATIDINANICRLVVDSAKLLKENPDFTQIYVQRILKFTQEAFDESDKFIFRDKKYVINKQLFKLYWCLETLQNFYMDVEKSTLEQILSKGAEQNEYTIREKVAQVVKLSGDFQELAEKLKFDENYYVRAVFS